MCDGDRIVRAHLQQQISTGEFRFQTVDSELRKRCQPRRPPLGQTDRIEHTGAESDGHRQPCGPKRQFGFGIGQRGCTGSEPSDVLGPDLQDSDQLVAPDAILQIQPDERRVCLRRNGIDSGLMNAAPRHRVGSGGRLGRSVTDDSVTGRCSHTRDTERGGSASVGTGSRSQPPCVGAGVADPSMFMSMSMSMSMVLGS